MYIGLGAVTIIMSLAVTFLLETTSRRRLYGALPLALALILLAARLLLSFDFLWFYPPLWLWISMMWSLQALFTWGLAGMATNTRQAKRLFPLFGAGGILGVSLGGLATQPLVSLLGAENLILIWSGSLAVAYGLARLLLAKLDGPELDARVRSTRRGRQVRLTANLTAGFEYVRKSPLLRWLSAGVVLFAVLFFSITFPFSKAATARFPDEDALSGFLGLFLGISTGIAFLISLFLANRLYARFGIMVMVLAYPVIYLAGFLLLFLFESFATLVVFRFVQILFYQGIAGSAYQAVYNAVPPDRRDQTRTFIDGVPGQIGVILAGVLLLLSERMLDARQLFLLAASLSALTAYATWRSGRAYRGALVEALRAGYPLLFDTEDEPFGGFQRDATAVAAVVEGIHHPDPVVRRVSAEILGSLSVPEATDALVNALDDEDAQVRAALLRSLAGSGAVSALLEVLLCLEDPSPEVREEAVKAVRTLSGYPRGVAVRIRPLLADPDPRVRAGTAVTLLSSGEDPEAEEVLAVMLAERDLDSRLAALNAVAGWGGAGAYDLVRNSLYDEHAVVRQAAVEALAATDPGRCLMPLVDATGDEDTDVQKAVAEALGAIGARALEPTLAALADPTREEGALLALEHIPLDGKAGTLHAYARDRIARALHYHRLSRQEALLVERDAEALLRDSLSRKALTLGTNALRALGLIRNRASIEMARKHLQSENADERANALEVLENIQDAALVRPSSTRDLGTRKRGSQPAAGWMA
jgi:HEAT repeat protein